MQQQEIKTTGTTTVGLVCRDCVILAAESKSTMGWLVSSKTAQKLHPVDDRIAVTISGAVGDAAALIRILRAEIRLYKLMRNADFSVRSAANLLSNILQGTRYYPYMAMLIVAGVDKTGSHVYSVDPIGGTEEDRYTATGSGSPMAYGVLEDGFRDGMAKDEGVKLAVRAIRAAAERDVFSGGKDINVAIIDKDGIQYADREKIKELAK